MTSLSFSKGHGTGNDFVLLIDPDGEQPLTPDLVTFLCDRRFGVGADGVIRAVRSRSIEEGAAILEAEPAAEWFMDYWNADGTPAEMCGNGIRVFVHFLIEEGLAVLDPGETLPVGTRSGVRDTLESATGYTVDLGRWRLGSEHLVLSDGLNVPRPGLSIGVGNPHIVTALADESTLERLQFHEAPTSEPALEAGANFEFVVPHEPLIVDGVGHISMRVYERGSGETLSCGTGAAAAALAFRHWGGAGMPNSWNVDVPGGRLSVRMFEAGAGEHVSLSGPAELVFSGTIEVP